MSVGMKKVHALAEAYDRKLRATDGRFRNAVQIVHEDGTVLFVRNAFLMRHGEWVVFFSEHNGFSVFHSGDLTSFTEFSEVHVTRRLK